MVYGPLSPRNFDSKKPITRYGADTAQKSVCRSQQLAILMHLYNVLILCNLRTTNSYDDDDDDDDAGDLS